MQPDVAIGFGQSWRETPGRNMCPSRMSSTKVGEKAGDFLNLSLTWSKSVDNAGYDGNESGFLKNHVKVGKMPCTLVQVGPQIGLPTNPGSGSEAGLLALGVPVLDGGLDYETNSGVHPGF